ncbi:hypothetical protein QTP70_008180 [Hemibagrus guttatus]|uniref:Contactin-associated protein-like 2 n=1 Tax=Hemibagrus guttatus TaxID=175788 RepID=A0AAE0Q7Z3_9TELE|nr:hypothetical protein QTP70_008180 [Hemibagrus guttatus]
MRVSTSKSEAMVLDREKVACTLQVGGEFLPQVEEFKYLGVLFTSEGRMDREIDRRIGAAAAVMRSMYRSVVVKKELSRKAKLSIYQSIYVPTLTYGHELWVMTERIRSRIQAAKMSFLRRVAGCSFRDRVRTSVTREELGVEPLLLHIERGQLRWLGHLFRMPLGRLPGEVFRACHTGKRPRGRRSTRWRDYVSRLAWERLGVPPEELEEVSGERERENMIEGPVFLSSCDKLRQSLTLSTSRSARVTQWQLHNFLCTYWNAASFNTPSSYLHFPTFRAETSADISFYFKTSAPHGVFLENLGSTDFIRLELKSPNVVTFSFDVGNGPVELNVHSPTPLNDDQWHRVSAERNVKEAVLQLDQQYRQVRAAPAQGHTRLELYSQLYVGRRLTSVGGGWPQSDLLLPPRRRWDSLRLTPHWQRRSPATPPSLPPFEGFRPSRAEVVARLDYASGDVARLCCSALLLGCGRHLGPSGLTAMPIAPPTCLALLLAPPTHLAVFLAPATYLALLLAPPTCLALLLAPPSCCLSVFLALLWVSLDGRFFRTKGRGWRDGSRAVGGGGYCAAGGQRGFLGCIRSLKMNGVTLDLEERAKVTPGVKPGCSGHCTSFGMYCRNGGKCVEKYNGYSCDCSDTAYDGPFCTKDVGAFFEAGTLVRYNLVPEVSSSVSSIDGKDLSQSLSTDLNLTREYVSFSFSTSSTPSILLYISSRSQDYMAVVLQRNGSLQLRYNLGGLPFAVDLDQRNLANGQPHSANITRTEREIHVQLDHYPLVSYTLPEASDTQFNQVKSLFLGKVYETGPIDPVLIEKYNTPGFVGCLSRVQFNSIAPLKAALRSRLAVSVSHQGKLVESNCGASPLTVSPMSTNTDPWHLNADADFPFNEERVVPDGVNRNSAVIGGIIAVVIFTILCTLVFLIRYMFRHKGTYHTNESKGEERFESADTAIISAEPNFTETIEENKKEWFI